MKDNPLERLRTSDVVLGKEERESIKRSAVMGYPLNATDVLRYEATLETIEADSEMLTDALRELDQIRRVLGCPMEEADILQAVKDLKERVAKQEEVVGARNAEIRDLKLQNGWDAEAALELTEIQEALDKVILAEGLYEEDFSYPQIVQFLAGRARDFGFLLGEFLDGVNDGRVEKALAQSRGEISPNGEPAAAPASSVEEGGTFRSRNALDGIADRLHKALGYGQDENALDLAVLVGAARDHECANCEARRLQDDHAE